jgi:hypothetical protein
MTENTRIVHATPDRVWQVLSDGWLYPLWVVGATRIREVDDRWPAVGSRLHHSVGLWPVLLDDDTEVTDANPGVSLSLRARAWPTGAAAVHIHLSPHGPDTEVRMAEDVVSGPGRLVPPPLRGVTLKWRNTESLRRLAYLAERRR